jgi:ectoine hydroxylase-related dioxygenase (phytanoyl-CoA dioxygenase family)
VHLPMEDFRKPFPALTPTQRLHIEVYGYVVIEKAISDNRVETLLENILEIERVYRETGEYPYGIIANAHSRIDPDYFRIDNLPHILPCFFDYLTDPYLVGMAQEIVGTHVRLLQSDAHVIRYPREKMERQGYGFHSGWHPESGSTTNGLYHCPFIKTLTNLTDLGPDDSGTAVIAGSHKLAGIDRRDLIETAVEDPDRLIHQVVAPAGSTLLFFESLLHSGGLCKSGKTRVFILGGYWPSMFQPHQGYEPNEEFLQTVPLEYHPVLTGSRCFQLEKLTRELKAPADKYPFAQEA